MRAIWTADLLATAASTALRRRPLGLPHLLNLFDDSPSLSPSSPSQALAAVCPPLRGPPPAACTRAATSCSTSTTRPFALALPPRRWTARSTALYSAGSGTCKPPNDNTGTCPAGRMRPRGAASAATGAVPAARRFCPAVDIAPGAPCSSRHHASQRKKSATAEVSEAEVNATSESTEDLIRWSSQRGGGKR